MAGHIFIKVLSKSLQHVKENLSELCLNGYISIKLLYSILVKKCNPSLVRKKWNKKDFITCSKLIINELEHCLTRSDNVYFANNEQASLAVFTAAFCFAHTEHNLIKLKLYNNWSGEAVSNISDSAMWNSSKPTKFPHLWKLANQSTLNEAHVLEITKACTVAFMKARNSLVVWCREECVN